MLQSVFRVALYGLSSECQINCLEEMPQCFFEFGNWLFEFPISRAQLKNLVDTFVDKRVSERLLFKNMSHLMQLLNVGCLRSS